MNLTIQQVFGANASQTEDTLSVYLPGLGGLDTSGNVTPSALLAGIINQANQWYEGSLHDASNVILTDAQNRVLNYDQTSLYNDLNITYWGKTYPTGKVRKIFLASQWVVYEP